MFRFTESQPSLILRAIDSMAYVEMGMCKMVDSFFTSNRYFDNKNYPRGFSRHGHFTIREAQLLERCGHAYNDLNSGKREPVTDEERQFVAVCHGELVPANKHEKVWFKYIEHTRRPKRFHTLSGGKPQINVVEDYTDTED